MRETPDAIILCGGAGLRLRTVTGAEPKAMAAVAGRPFLELLLRQLRRHGFSRVILAVGYQGDVIRSHFGPRPYGLNAVYAIESSPLGTGGALRYAADLVESNAALVMNGDSYTRVDLRKFAAVHFRTGADVSVLAAPAHERVDCGSLLVDRSGRLIGFEEKAGAATAQLINAGIYTISRQMLFEIPIGRQISLEQELFPEWIRKGRTIRVGVNSGECVDIGTPDRYRAAQHVLANVEPEADWEEVNQQ